jgi:hypothetical protein
MKRLAAPPLEIAQKFAAREYIFLDDVAFLANTSKDVAELFLQQGKLRRYPFSDRHGILHQAFLTFQVKKVLAARGRIIPGFNEDSATQRQWLEMLDSAMVRPLDNDWYFPPVNPDPLVNISEDVASKILEAVKENMGLEGPPSEILRLIADTVNLESRPGAIRRKM